ncbi:mucin-2-like, partial [Cydia fagiglandana]|uniref:mucin-2-like n=1 Tax=Cydia fagiglandana TaxID=1458189 RepID=UPI002FEE5F99
SRTSKNGKLPQYSSKDFMLIFCIHLISVPGIIEFQKCCGDSIQDDWRRQGFYRPRRNFPSQSQNGNSFQQNHHNYQSQSFRPQQARTDGQNSQNQFGTNTYQNSQKQNIEISNTQAQYSFGGRQTSKLADLSTGSQNQGFGASYQNTKLPSNNENYQSRNAFGFNSNTFRSEYQNGGQNTVGSRVGQNSFGLSQNLQAPNNGQKSLGSSFSSQSAFGSYNPKQNSFGSFSQNSQAFGNFGQKVQAQNPVSNFQNQNTFPNFGSNFAKGQNYQASGYLPPRPYKAPEYLPPDESKTTSTTKRPFFTTTTTKRPFFTTSTTRRPFYTTTKRTFFTTTTTKRPLFTTTTKTPFFTTSTTKRPFFTSTTTKKPITTTTKRPIYTTTPDHQVIFPDKIPKHPIGAVAPAMAMIVPPEPEDDEDEIIPDFRTTTQKPAVLPAMAMIVPPEEDDPITISTTTLVTTPSTTKMTTPSTTVFTTPSTSTTFSTTSSTTITSPSTTISTTPSTTLTIPDFNRNQEEETTPTTETTTVITETKTTPTTKPPVVEETTPITETTTVIPVTKATTTTKRPFIGIGYLPPDPKTTSTTTVYPDLARAQPAAGADEVPLEAECDPWDPSTWPTLYEQRTYGELPCAPVTTTLAPITTTTKRPIYTTTPDHQVIFPDKIPKHPIGAVAPAMAMIVPPEPEDDEDEIIPDFRTTTQKPAVLPAMAMIVPPEEGDPITISTTTLVTTPSTTKMTTPSTTVFTTPSTSTTFSTTSSTTITSPSTTISTTFSTPSTTLTTPDFNRNQEEETTPTTETTTVITVTKATPTSKPPVVEDTTPTTETTTVIPVIKATTTTKRPFIGIGYLPPDPKTTSTTTIYPDIVRAEQPAAGADEVPLEAKCNPLDPSTWPTLYEQRTYGELPCTPVTTTQAPLPPPAPARADPVPPEPECDPLDPSTWPSEVDQRDFGETPCASVSSPTTTSSTTTTTTTTPSTTISTTPSTTTSATPSTTTSTTPSTTTSTTTSTTPSTTTSTTPSTTTSTTPSTTTSTTPSTTTSTTTSTTPSTTTSTSPSTTTSTPSTTTSTTTTTTTIKPPYIGRGYLPPTNDTLNLPPSPAQAEPVPPEPECDPLDPSTWPSEFDQRYYGASSCAPNITKPPVDLTYPPDCIVKKRKRRASEVTLRLKDVQGTPRPVWYAGIYRKTTDPYLPICGGSIVREDVVISAAHCFWNDAVGLQPAHQFAVAASKIYKPWKDPMDKKAQKSDVLDIKIPARFLGAKTSFQEDIAILKLATPFKYTRGVRPICVDFDDDFDRQQMKAGHHGTIAGWGLTDSVGTPTQRLLWLELPYIEIEKCIRDSEDAFLKYITCDKVCAGENDTGKALCKGDSGGGLAFWSGPAEHATPYLRGIASTAPSPRNAECNVYAYGSFTHVRAHRTFLRDHVPEIESCRFWE